MARHAVGLILLPIRFDDAVIETAEPWLGKLRDNRNIGDFLSMEEPRRLPEGSRAGATRPEEVLAEK
jgi:hypothetical protein